MHPEQAESEPAPLPLRRKDGAGQQALVATEMGRLDSQVSPWFRYGADYRRRLLAICIISSGCLDRLRS